jgi:hypothetical protein
MRPGLRQRHLFAPALLMVALRALACLDFDATSRGMSTTPSQFPDGSASTEEGGADSVEASALVGDDSALVGDDSVDAGPWPPTTDSPDPLDGGIDDSSPTIDASGWLEGAAECDPGLLCNGQCVDPTRDPANCGACGTVCASGVCGTSIVASFTAPPDGRWQFAGNAHYDATSQSVHLARSDAGANSGTFVYSAPVTFDGFDAAFDFRMTCAFRGDGMGFMWEQAGAGLVGASGPGLGVLGLGGYAIELDIHDDHGCGDTNNNHVAVDSLASCEVGEAGALLPIPQFVNELAGTRLNLADGAWHSAQAHFLGGALSVSVDALSVAQNVSLPGYAAAPFYFGFGASSSGRSGPDGGTGCDIEVRRIHIELPTPACL